MNDAPVYVGLDYHNTTVQVCILDREGKVLANRPCRNDWQAIIAAVAGHSARPRAAIEACTGSADLADELVAKAGWHVDLAHPGLRRYRRPLGLRHSIFLGRDQPEHHEPAPRLQQPEFQPGAVLRFRPLVRCRRPAV